MSNKGIWGYTDKLQPFVQKKYRLSLSEGNTPLENNRNLAKELDVQEIYLKREDLNPTGSHKDRGLTFQISAHVQDGKKEFVISSSGNSAISAVKLLKNTQKILHLFLSSNLSVQKIARLVSPLENISNEIFKGKDIEFENFTFNFSNKPLSNAFSFAKENGLTLLRGSTDKYGSEGYKTIMYEIESQKIDYDSIFIPTSSGTTAKGIYEAFETTKPLHLIQTTKINTLVHRFDKKYNPSVTSLADSIVDRVGHRAIEIEEIIKNSKGTGWIISDDEILNAQEILKNLKIKTSNESALTIAGIIKAKKNGWEIKRPLCIFTGTY